MDSYSFGKRSSGRLDKGHPDLKRILEFGIANSPIDFGISCVGRTFAQQLVEFENGSTTLDPRDSKMLQGAMHVVTPYRPFPMAADIYIYHPDKATQRRLMYDKASLSYVWGVIGTGARVLHAAGEVEHLIRWGGNWDKDGVILDDQSFDDLPHGELYLP